MEPSITKRIIKKGKRVGMLMAFKFEGNKVGMGFCLCSATDKYNHDLAKKICLSRAKSEDYDVPPSIIKDFDGFAERCRRYFKDCEGIGEN